MEDSKSLIRRFVEELWNEGRLEHIGAFFTPDFVDHTPVAPGLPAGIDGARAVVALFRHAFPDLEFTVLDMVAEGDRIAWRWCSTGTHRGEALGVGPTGRRAHRAGDRALPPAGWPHRGALGRLRRAGVDGTAGHGRGIGWVGTPGDPPPELD